MGGKEVRDCLVDCGVSSAPRQPPLSINEQRLLHANAAQRYADIRRYRSGSDHHRLTDVDAPCISRVGANACAVL